MNNENILPKITAGVLIVNKAGQVLLIKSPKWQGQYIIPGGHVEWQEKLEAAAKREVKEEVGLEIYDLEFLKPTELILPKKYHKKTHFIAMDFVAKTDAQADEVVLDNREGVEYKWLLPEDALALEEIEPTVADLIRIYLTNLENKDYQSKWKRALADYQNLQKEVLAQKKEWAKMSELQILEEFIPVYDNFKAAFNVEVTEGDGWQQGIKYIMKQYGQILKNHDIEEIKTVGEKVDLALHEVAGEESGNKKSQTILKEIQGGYKMGEKVIRPARVIINK